MSATLDELGSRAAALGRRCAAPVTILLIVVALASDWPIGWRWWVEHPLIAAFVPGVLIVLLTVAVLDAYLRRREARRWRAIGHAAASEFSVMFNLFFVAVFQLLGVDLGARLSQGIECHLEHARQRAAKLMPSALTHEEAVVVAQNKEAYQAQVRERVPVLASDELWRDRCAMTLLTLARDQQAAIARWVGTFGMVGDDIGFNQVASSVAVLDRVNALLQT